MSLSKILVLLSIPGSLGCASGGTGAPSSELQARLERSLSVAGENRKELEAAMEAALPEHRGALRFLAAQTGERSFWSDWETRTPDAAVISAQLLLTHVRLGYEARRRYLWAQALDEDTFRRFVLSYRMTTERLADWRSHFWHDSDVSSLMEGYALRFKAAPTDAERDRVFREMIHAVNTGWVGRRVPYAPRGMPDLNPLEAMVGKTGRCTDQTNTLIAILRTFGIAATGVRVVAWPEANDNHTWTAVFDPVTKEWLDVDSGQGGAVTDPSYFKKFIRSEPKKAAKVYWVVPGEDGGGVSSGLALKVDETFPPLVEKYLVAKPMVDRTDRYTDVGTLERRGLPPRALIWLAVWNAGLWRPVAGSRSDGEGCVRFGSVGCDVRYRLMTWSRIGPAFRSRVLIPRKDGSMVEEPVD